MNDEVDGKHGVQSLEIGMGILRAMVNGQRSMMLKEIAAGADMPASKAHRYLVSLIRAGLVEQDPASSRYDLGPFALNIGLVALDLETQARRVFASQDRDDLMAFGVCSSQVVVSYAEVSNSQSPPFRWSQAFDARTGEPLRDRYEAADMFAFSADGRRALFLLWGSVALVEDGQRQDVLEAVVPDPRCAVFLEPSGLVLGGASGALYCGSHVAG